MGVADGVPGGTLVAKASGVSLESDEELLRPEWALDQIELSDSDSEYFDAQGTYVCMFMLQH